MSDTGFVLSIILWIGINALIGYAIGKSKNAIADCVALSVILGPIGWLVALAIKGQVRKCPFCAELVRPEANVCKHCGRDLPAEPAHEEIQKIKPPAGGWRK
jgi:hypothetical protein